MGRVYLVCCTILMWCLLFLLLFRCIFDTLTEQFPVLETRYNINKKNKKQVSLRIEDPVNLCMSEPRCVTFKWYSWLSKVTTPLLFHLVGPLYYTSIRFGKNLALRYSDLLDGMMATLYQVSFVEKCYEEGWVKKDGNDVKREFGRDATPSFICRLLVNEEEGLSVGLLSWCGRQQYSPKGARRFADQAAELLLEVP